MSDSDSQGLLDFLIPFGNSNASRPEVKKSKSPPATTEQPDITSSDGSRDSGLVSKVLERDVTSVNEPFMLAPINLAKTSYIVDCGGVAPNTDVVINSLISSSICTYSNPLDNMIDHEDIFTELTRKLYKSQVAGLLVINRAIKENKKGFILADGTGVGKGNLLAASLLLFYRDKINVLIVKGETLAEKSMKKEFNYLTKKDKSRSVLLAGDALGTTGKKAIEGNPIKAGSVYIVTIKKLPKFVAKLKESGADVGLLAIDEVHEFVTAAEAQEGLKKMYNAFPTCFKIYSSATLELDKIRDNAMFIKDIPDLSKLGEDSATNLPVILHREGIYLNREVSLDDVSVERMLCGKRGVTSKYNPIRLIFTNDDNWTAQSAPLLRQLLIADKLEEVIEETKKEIKQGRKVIIYLETINDIFAKSKNKSKSTLGTMYDEWEKNKRGKFNIIRLKMRQIVVGKSTDSEDVKKTKNVAYQEAINMIPDSGWPPNPIDYLRAQLKEERVVELTSRKKRILIEGGTTSVPEEESVAFSQKNGQAMCLIMSQKGNTGLSLHHEHGNNPRTMILLDIPWMADKLMQTFGRIHRSGGLSVPRFRLAVTHAPADELKISTVLSRLRSLQRSTQGGTSGLVDDIKGDEDDSETEVIMRYLKMLAKTESDQKEELEKMTKDAKTEATKAEAAKVKKAKDKGEVPAQPRDMFPFIDVLHWNFTERLDVEEGTIQVAEVIAVPYPIDLVLDQIRRHILNGSINWRANDPRAWNNPTNKDVLIAIGSFGFSFIQVGETIRLRIKNGKVMYIYDKRLKQVDMPTDVSDFSKAPSLMDIKKIRTLWNTRETVPEIQERVLVGRWDIALLHGCDDVVDYSAENIIRVRDQKDPKKFHLCVKLNDKTSATQFICCQAFMHEFTKIAPPGDVGVVQHRGKGYDYYGALCEIRAKRPKKAKIDEKLEVPQWETSKIDVTKERDAGPTHHRVASEVPSGTTVAVVSTLRRVLLQTVTKNPIDLSKEDKPAHQPHRSKQLFTWNAITIWEEDRACLAPGEWLNDNVMEFYARYVYLKLAQDNVRDEVHLMNTHFFSTMDNKWIEEEEKEITNQAESQYRVFATVRSWTNAVDVFGKRYIIVPIYKDKHWSVAIIAFVSPVVDAAQTPSTQRQPPKATVYLLDSLRKTGHDAKRTKALLKLWLNHEWAKNGVASAGKHSAFEVTDDMFSDCVRMSLEVPQQPDGVNCGVYALNNIEQFLVRYHEIPDEGLFAEFFLKPDSPTYRTKLIALIGKLTQEEAEEVEFVD